MVPQQEHRRSRILGTGSCVPDAMLTNADLEKRVDTTDGVTCRPGLTI